MALSGSAVKARGRILRAAADILTRGGEEAITTRDVAEAAQVQVSALYRLFGDKETLLEAAVTFSLEEYVDGKSSEADGNDSVLALEQAWEAHLAYALANPALFALISGATWDWTGSLAADAGFRLLRQRVGRVAREGRLRVNEALALQLVWAGVMGAVAALLQTPLKEPDQALATTLRKAIMAYILGESQDRAQTTTASLSTALRARLNEMSDLTQGERRWLSELLDRLSAAPQDTRPSGRRLNQAACDSACPHR